MWSTLRPRWCTALLLRRGFTETILLYLQFINRIPALETLTISSSNTRLCLKERRTSQEPCLCISIKIELTRDISAAESPTGCPTILMGGNRSHHLFPFLQQCRSNAQTPRNVTSYSFPRSSSPTHKTKMVLQLDRTPIPEWVFTGHLRQISLPRRLLATPGIEQEALRSICQQTASGSPPWQRASPSSWLPCPARAGPCPRPAWTARVWLPP